MIVNKENFGQVFEIFKNSCDIAKFVSFDCEMTGLKFDIKTDPTKYDTQEYRYYKVKQVVEKFDLIQLGLTFFIEKEKDINNSNNNVNNGKEQYYLERSFTFYLFKTPQMKYFNNDKSLNIYSLESLSHPDSLKFLAQNNFDFNTLIRNGIHYNKLTYTDKIKNYLNNEKDIINNGSFFLSKENEKDLCDNIIKLTEFLLLTQLEKGQKKPTLLLKFNNKQTMNFLLGCNFKQILFIDNFNIQKLKGEENIVEIKITKNAEILEFETKYKSLDNFKELLRNNPKILYELRYQPQNMVNNGNNEYYINKLIEEELGFTKYIKYLCDKKIPIIGHNIYFDTMFIYDKLIGDLPDDFYIFKTEIHKYFPIIYDTKSISSRLKKYEKTSLDSLRRTINKNKYDSYVSFVEDIENGFNYYESNTNNEKLHDAGYDSKITGECFILMNKALENNYMTDNKNNNDTNKKKKKQKKDNNTINNVHIKYGFCNLSLFDQFKNISFISLIESDYGKVLWDTTEQSKDAYDSVEKSIINNFKNVFMIKFKWNLENKYLINNYEIANLFKNNEYDLNVIKIDYDKFLVEFYCENYNNEKDYNKIINIITEIKNKNSVINDKLIIDDVYPYDIFIAKFRDLFI